MKSAEAIAEILKREGVETLIAYPVNHIIEYAARADIRTVIVRQERIGLHMADAMARLSSGKNVGVFCMQHGPGAENAFGGVAQAWGESAPVLVMPMGYARRIAHMQPNFNSVLNFQHVTKSAEPVMLTQEIPNIMRRAFTALRNGRPGPALIEVPTDIFGEDFEGELDYTPVISTRSGPDPADVEAAAETLANAERLVIYAGQGVHYAEAWPQLKQLSEMLAAPVATSLGGKSAFDETHPLSLGAGGRGVPKALHEFLQKSDVIFGIGCSFTETSFGVGMPKGKTIVHATLDAADINKDVIASHALVGDAALTLDALIPAVEAKLSAARDAAPVAAEIKSIKEPWLAEWAAKRESDETPLSPYRVLNDLSKTVDMDNTIITHDAGSPRDQLSPFWESTTPLSYIGWGKTTQLGYGLGLAMGAKLAKPDKLCINVWGDAAIGFTGMDFETAVRERIPILSILLNNFSMAIELHIMQQSTEKYRATDISGDYAAMARAFGGYGERVTDPDEIIPAIKRGIEQTEAGVPALLEFITCKETEISSFK
ncbi:MAG: thiamine pyrophosphate-requiring protein [Rhodospirillaceae bacterium]|nr:thiamine pyrophosphate-requiring protein [Rhodospirillaceae bacterium]MDD9918231.1 thiamine pyrophosphate-requiring protein [Rhodospirillaceae bacterium]MDD9926218.1 thiamine pyrophosphate-requiring protein [Rhodospirillaceae bacterium]